MSRVFLSYRRADSQHVTDRIYDRLTQEFGPENVFKDVDSIPLGADFHHVIRESVCQTDVFLAVIGPNWLNATDEAGRRRLDDPDDFVRVEIETAMANSIDVVPLTIGGATVPAPSDLPEAIAEMASRQALAVRPDPDFHNDIARLIRSIQRPGGGKSDDGSVMEDAFVEVLKHRAEVVLMYIRGQCQEALSDARRHPRKGETPDEVQRRYDNATERFRTLHAQYLESICANKPQLSHQILGELYQLLYRCRHTSRHEDPPPMLLR